MMMYNCWHVTNSNAWEGFHRMLIFVILLIFGIINTVNAMPTGFEVGTFRKCSKELSQMLELICADTGYNSPMDIEEYDEVDLNEVDDNEEVIIVRHKRGVVEECCHNNCSKMDLETYCRPAKKADHRIRSKKSN